MLIITQARQLPNEGLNNLLAELATAEMGISSRERLTSEFRESRNKKVVASHFESGRADLKAISSTSENTSASLRPQHTD